MKRFTGIAALLSALVLCSCESEFPVHIEAKPGIYLYALAGPEGVYVDGQYASPSSDKVGKKVLENKKIRVMTSGETFESSESGITDVSLDAGDKVSVSVSSSNLGSVFAECEIPAEPVLKSTKLVDLPMFGTVIPKLEVTLSLEEGMFYGFRVIRRVKNEEEPGWSMEFDMSIITMLSTTSGGDMFDVRVPLVAGGSFCEITMASPDCFKDGTVGLVLSDSEIEAYKVVVYSLSESFYRYSMARYKAESDFLAAMGLAPAAFAWSNVPGGFGFCGAYNLFESDWIEVSEK